MMKSVLISIQPKWCALIESGKKTVEVRKTKPKLETPFKCYIYCTQGDALNYLKLFHHKSFNKFWIDNEAFGVNVARANGKVIGEFVCDRVRCEKEVADGFVDVVLESTSCVPYKELLQYANGNILYSWHISDLVIYDKPKELSEFYTIDNEAVQKCEHRVQSYFDGYCHSGYLKCGFYCSEKDDWCEKCKTKPITKPPQSWCYVWEGEQ